MKKEKKPKKKKEAAQKDRILCFVKGIAVAFAITCIIFIGYGILLTYTDLSEDTLPLVSMVCTAISAAAAGYDWAVCMKEKGLLWGMGAGLVYTVLLYLITGISSGGFTLELSGLMTVAVALAAGAAGGILGVNRK